MRKSYRQKTLDKLAKQIESSFSVWYNKLYGWWLETNYGEMFLGSDSVGAFNQIKKLNQISCTPNKTSSSTNATIN